MAFILCMYLFMFHKGFNLSQAIQQSYGIIKNDIGTYLHISITTGWTVMKFICPDVPGHQRMTTDYFGDLLTFLAVPPEGQSFHLSKINIYEMVWHKM